MTDTESLDVTPDHVSRMVMLVYGVMSNSNPFWCFVAVKPTHYNLLMRKIKDKTFDIRTYVEDGFGEIVVSGEGVIPPNDIVKTVATMFDTPVRKLFADVDMDTEIAKEIERVKKELGD